jgi:hypothetical protein
MKWWRWSLFFVPGVLGLVIGIWLNLAESAQPNCVSARSIVCFNYLHSSGMILLVLGAASIGHLVPLADCPPGYCARIGG